MATQKVTHSDSIEYYNSIQIVVVDVTIIARNLFPKAVCESKLKFKQATKVNDI